MLTRNEFLAILSKQLYPILRTEGFKGAGTTLRRINGPVIHIFNFQGSTSANQCFLNLGAHLTFLPPEGGLAIAKEKLDEPDCAFRGRIEPPSGPQFGWSYGENTAEALETAQFIVSEWLRTGHLFFQKYSNFPDGFVALISQQSVATTHPRSCLHYARIALEIGQNDQASRFAQSGLERAAEKATNLRAELKNILALANRS